MIITASEARTTLPALLDRVSAGEEITITRHGEAVATLVDPRVLRRRRGSDRIARAAALGEQLARARESALDDLPAISPERTEALISEVRRSRESR